MLANNCDLLEVDLQYKRIMDIGKRHQNLVFIINNKIVSTFIKS